MPKALDVAIGDVYRYVYGASANSPLAQRGPWLAGEITGYVNTDRRHVTVMPVSGLPQVDVRAASPADRVLPGVHMATPLAGEIVNVARLDGRLCHSNEWSTWVEAYTATEAANERARAQRAANEERAVIRLVASLMSRGLDVGRGPWDRSTPWSQYVDDLRRREPGVLAITAEAFDHYARPSRDDHERATEWYHRPVS